MPVVTAVIVLIFGGLTLVLHNDLFIKLKPTIIYVLFGGTLLGGPGSRQAVSVDPVRPVVSPDRRRLAQAHLALGAVLLRAGRAERDRLAQFLKRRFWVSFKLFGVVPLTFLFGALQYPLIMKYHPDAQK